MYYQRRHGNAWRTNLRILTCSLDGVHTKEDFEVIEIVDGTTPYPTLLGLDWVFDNHAIINLKTRKMTFESGEYMFIVPLDLSEGERFVEPTCLDLEEIDQLYRTKMCDEDYVNQLQMGYSVGGASLPVQQIQILV